MTTKTRRIALLYLAAVFLAGSVLGGAAHRFYEVQLSGPPRGRPHSASAYRQRLMAKLTQDLTLNTEQTQAVDVILDDIGKRYHEIRKTIEPQLTSLRAERAERIMALLDADQSAKYQTILDERRRRREAKKAAGCH